MVRYLILILSIFFFGCETSGQQLIKPEKFNFNEIKFDAVSKELLLSPCIHTESISQGICFPERQFIAWFRTMLKTCFFAISGSVISAFVIFA